MDEIVFALMEEGRRKLRQQEEDAKKRSDAIKAEREQKISEAREAIMQAVCNKLPEALWPYLHLDEMDGYFWPYENQVELIIPSIHLISLRVRYNAPDARISGKWITVAGIRYSPPQITDDNEVWEGEISSPSETGERQYGLEAWPYETDDITLALAIAEDRYDQFMELEIARKTAVEELQAQLDEQKRASLEQKASEVIPSEQFEGIQRQVGQINPLVVFEGWIREIVQDEIQK